MPRLLGPCRSAAGAAPCIPFTAVGGRAGYMLASDAFAALAASHPEFAGLSYETLGLKGRMTAGATAGAAV